MNRVLIGIFWIGLYATFVVGPAAMMTFIPPVPAGRDFWTELSVALGFIGLAQLLIQFVLVARFRSITAPYGIDVILYYHRQIGAVAVFALLAHPLILIARDPRLLVLFDPLSGTWASRAGVTATAALTFLVLLSWLRKRLHLGYESWRLGHLLLAVVAGGAGIAHVVLGAGAYVNTPAKRASWVVFAGLLVAPLAYHRLVKPLVARRRRPYRVLQVTRVGGVMWSLAIEPVGHPGLVFEPGQFVWLALGSPFSVDEHPLSLASSAEHPDRLEFGVREAGDFTRAIGRVRPDTLAYVEGPHGAFSIDRVVGAGYVFIAGGAGVVPFVSMARTMVDRGDRRPVLLIYAGRTEDDLAYRNEFERLAAANGWELRIICVLESPPAGWPGETGRVTADLLRRVLPKERIAREFLICGPDAMVVGVERVLVALGVKPCRLHTERFEIV